VVSNPEDPSESLLIANPYPRCEKDSIAANHTALQTQAAPVARWTFHSVEPSTYSQRQCSDPALQSSLG